MVEPSAIDFTPSATDLLAQAQQQLTTLAATNANLESEKADLEIMLETVTLHSTDLEQQLYDKNQEILSYLREVEKVTAAAGEVEEGTFELASLDAVALRGDPLGQLARVFQQMVRQVEAREQKLKQQVLDLTIEIDQAKRSHAVAQVVGSESFQSLKDRVQRMKQARKANEIC
jgi:hypothetical protein